MIRDALSWIYEQVQWGSFSLGAILVEFVPIALLASALVGAVLSLFGGTGQMAPTVPNAGSPVTQASYSRPPPPSPGKPSFSRSSNQQQNVPAATVQQRTVATPVQSSPRRQVPISDNVIPFDANAITEESTTTEVYKPSGPTH